MNIHNYNGRINVNIRQFFKHTISGEEKAGNEGITLSIDQWKTLAEHVFINLNFNKVSFVSFLVFYKQVIEINKVIEQITSSSVNEEENIE